MARPLPGRRRDWTEEPGGGCRRRGTTAAQIRGRQRERRKRTVAREDRPHGERPPFRILEVEAMSRRVSPSSKQPYGVARVISVWDLARSSFYAARRRQQHSQAAQKRGPKLRSDDELVAEIRELLASPIFAG